MLLRTRPYLDKFKDIEDELIGLDDDISHQTAQDFTLLFR